MKVFRGLDLSGSSFKDQDLTKADFTDTKIQGVNFSGANLKNAIFVNAQAGLKSYWVGVSVLITGLFSLLFGFEACRIGAWILRSEASDSPISLTISFVTGILLLSIWLAFLLLTRFKGLFLALVIIIGFLAVLSIPIAVGAIITGYTLTYLGVNAYTDAILAIALSSVLIIFFYPAYLVAEDKIQLTCPIAASLGVIGVIELASGPIEQTLNASGNLGLALPLTIGITVSLMVININKSIYQDNENYEFIRRFANIICSRIGTRFDNADLTGANFSGAYLKGSNFRTDKVDRTLWYNARGLDYVWWGNNILRDPKVRDLLITRLGKDKSYAWVNLEGADLKGVDFRNANLEGSRLANTNFHGANLECACLKMAKAPGANFAQAELTAACIEGWVINHATCLNGVKCRYIFHLKEPLPNTDNYEREPRQGEFEPGDFEELYKIVLDTVKLIFRGAIDRKALALALTDIKRIHENTEVESVKNHPNGMLTLTLRVPENTNRDDIYLDFQKSYHDALRALSKQQERSYRELQATQLEILNLATDLRNELKNPDKRARQSLVILTFWDGSLEEGHNITAEFKIKETSSGRFRASLSSYPELLKAYKDWKKIYRNTCGSSSRVVFKENDDVITNISYPQLITASEILESSFNRWLKLDSFCDISNRLRESLSMDDEISILIQTEDNDLRRLPWHLWDFFKTHRNAGHAFGLSSQRLVESTVARSERRILSIFGNYHDIDVREDRKILETMLGAEAFIKPMLKPSRQSFNHALWNPHGWDILSFSGHSNSEDNDSRGVIWLNSNESLDLNELRSAISIAVEKGLKLMLFNSCDGLGIVKNLESVNVPFIIAMQEVIPDRVAQVFLERLTRELVSGKSIYVAFNQAKAYLQGLENDYPCASWLPVLFHNPIEPVFYWRE
jgi:uncharacterized protein YjbI with pentapeptide repeats